MSITDTVEVETPSPFPGVWPSIGWVALFLLLQVVAGAIALIIAVTLEGGQSDVMAIIGDLKKTALPMIWSLVIAEILLLGLLWRYLNKNGRMAAVRLDRWSKMPLAQTVGISVLLIGVGIGFNWTYGTFIVPDIEIQADLRRLFAAIPETLPNSILLFVAIALIAPLLEELLFRGLLQNAFAHKLPIWAAIALSALIFGAMHMDLYAMPPLVLMGAMFGLIYHLTGSLRVTISLHMINNAAALLLS